MSNAKTAGYQLVMLFIGLGLLIAAVAVAIFGNMLTAIFLAVCWSTVTRNALAVTLMQLVAAGALTRP